MRMVIATGRWMMQMMASAKVMALLALGQPMFNLKQTDSQSNTAFVGGDMHALTF